MASIHVEANSPLAKEIQKMVQPVILEHGWVADEEDLTLAEYIVMLLVNGKDEAGLVQELAAEVLVVDPSDPAPAEFGKQLFESVRALAAQQQQQEQAQASANQQQQAALSGGDVNMDTPPTDAPTGPKSMRNGSAPRGRGGRILSQLNRQMDRSNEPDQQLHRIKGAAGLQTGRINSHASGRGTPRGPRTASSGLQRMSQGAVGSNPNMGMMFNPNDPGAQMFMNMMSQMLNPQMMQQAAAMNGSAGRGNRAGRGSRATSTRATSQAHATNGRLPDGPLQADAASADTAMGNSDTQDSMFNTLCRFNLSCTNPTCGFAHQSPSAPPNIPVDMTDTCSYGAACKNFKCSARHPSPAQKRIHQQSTMIEADCKFFPNCTNARCPFRHPTEPPCRNGADCSVPNCKFAHSKIACRYNPCTNPTCSFKHVEGQRGKFADKTWTANGSNGEQQQQNGSNGNGTADRFKEFANQDETKEELIVPDTTAENGNGNGETVEDLDVVA